MIKQTRFHILQSLARLIGRTDRRKVRWLMVLSNVMLFAGGALLVYVGWIYSQATYYREAARGDNNLPAPQVVARTSSDLAFSGPVAMPSFNAPDLSGSPATVNFNGSPLAVEASQITRMVMPSVGIDAKVIEVGWHVEEIDGAQVAVWEVAEFAVGHHRGTFNPGQGSNVVLAGHVGGFGKVFKDLFYARVGDQVTLYSNDRQYLYTVRERIVVDEEDAPFEQRIANARFLEPTPSETVTIISCWPPSGPNKYKQRIILRAVPYETPGRNTSIAWSIR